MHTTRTSTTASSQCSGHSSPFCARPAPSQPTWRWHAGRTGVLPRSRASQQEPSDGPPKPSLADPAQTIVWGGRLPSTRRAVTGGLASLAIVLGGNLGGCTSFLLGLDDGQLASRLRLDLLVPVKGYKRCVDYQNGFEFQYPAQWLADQTLLYRQAQRAEEQRSLDLPSLARSKERARRRNVVEPSAAFGPAGTTGEENISAIVAPIFTGFRLDSLGAPEEAAQRFIDNTFAPAGSGKEGTLIAATSWRDASGQLYYMSEFTIKAASFFRHNISVYTTRDDLLYTLNAQCPEEVWSKDGPLLQASAASFRLLPPSTSNFPTRL